MGQGSITSFTFAGLWDEWKDRATGETLKSCTMIVTKPNDLAAEIHDRMPAMPLRLAPNVSDGHSLRRTRSTVERAFVAQVDPKSGRRCLGFQLLAGKAS